MSNKPLIALRPAAITHFNELLNQETEKFNLRIEVANPGTHKADVGISFCPENDQEDDDLALNFNSFVLFVAKNSIAALRDAIIDYKRDDLGAQLTVNAPFIKGQMPPKDAPLRERVQYIIDNEINPNLASHGGFVTLVDIVDNIKVVIRFGGGCHGCGMADITLKSGIEKALFEHCPDIKEVIDATDHALGEAPYYTAKD